MPPRINFTTKVQKVITIVNNGVYGNGNLSEEANIHSNIHMHSNLTKEL
jgi:hypothetical protein